MSPLSTNIPICARCPMRQKDCNGACPCTVDGRDIVEHASKGDCPEGRFLPPGARCVRCHSPAHEVGACPIPDDYVATPANAVSGGCGCDGSQTRPADAHVTSPDAQAQAPTEAPKAP